MCFKSKTWDLITIFMLLTRGMKQSIGCYFIREKLFDGVIKTFHVSFVNQLVDLFTKSLGGSMVKYICKLGAYDIYAPSWGEILRKYKYSYR